VLRNNIDQGSWRGVEHRDDVVALVKRYISDGELAQKPLLVMPHSRVGLVRMVPTNKRLSIVLGVIACFAQL